MNTWQKIEAWVADCFKGVVGAIFATLAIALLQYVGHHISDIWQFLSQFAAATGAIRLTKK